MSAPRVAFHAPMKPPDHPVPSGDRRIARLTLAALERAGFVAQVVSRLRTLDMAGDPAAQARLVAAAGTEAGDLIERLRPDPPALWFTYHSYWKAPDLLGPTVAQALGIPYAISEASISARRRAGPWSGFAALAEASIARADRLFWTTRRDAPALEAAGHGAKMVHLPAFLEIGPAPAPRPAASPLGLLTVAMMRPGDKLESYRRIADGLARLGGDWRLTVVGDGAVAEEVRTLLAPFGGRVTFAGLIEDLQELRTLCEAADLFLWPGVNEGVGMAWLEAQAAGLPVVAEDGPAAQALVGGGRLAPPGDPAALAAAIEAAAADRTALSRAARAHVETHHSLDAAAATLAQSLRELLP